MEKLLIKKKCACGRTMVCTREKHGGTPQPVCGVCKKLGLELSRREFSNVTRKYNQTKFE